MVKELDKSEFRALGLDDEDFQQRRPDRGQITKREVRALTIYSMGLSSAGVVWDIGAGTGSISVEAALIARQGQVYAIERDHDSISLLEANVERWGPGNVNIVAGEAPEVLRSLPDPYSVFVGGSGGRLPEIIDYVAGRLMPGGTVVVNLAAIQRSQEAYNRLKSLGLEPNLVMTSAARGKEMPGGALRLDSLNPVFVVTGKRSG